MGVDAHPSGEHRSHHDHPPMNVALATPLFVLGGAIVVLAIIHLVTTLRNRRRLRAILENDRQLEFTRQSRVMAWLNRHFFYAPLFSKRHSNEFRIGRLHMGIVPLRLEALLIVLFLSISLVFFFCLLDYWETYVELMYQLKYAGGHVASMTMAVLVLSAGRNNPLSWGLGIPFKVWNLLHRWVGRLIVVGSIVHVAGAVASKAAEMGMAKTIHVIWHVPFFVYGMVAFIGFVAILIQSVSPLRHAFYESFLHLHIALAIMSFVGLWYHLRGLTQQWVLLGAIVLWAVERIARLASLVWHNWGSVPTTTQVEFLAGNVVRAEVALARTMEFKAGRYMYLYIPALSLWTSHPFSVAWTSTKGISVADSGRTNSSDSVNSLIKTRTQTTVSFLIKKRDGLTRKLLEKASQSDNNQFKATIWAEGPFGGLDTFNSYGTVVLIAGGVGITHPMSYMHQFLEELSNRKTAVRRVVLVWVVRSPEWFNWVKPWMEWIYEHHVMQDKGRPIQHYPDFSVAINLHVTEDRKDESMFEKSEDPSALYGRPGLECSTHRGRPDLSKTIEKEKETQSGAMIVTVCGPGSLCDDARAAVREAQEPKAKVHFHEESFTW
ncbi:ferric reductase family protein [Aspergillus undulatus]|uniref:ferric reductase family protein n=1 Tax=Aspergillus undulatus TaxID=1810928 RepID=UPI003CCCF7CA